ncbi:ZrgA family zinc uptake protein [Idiomarina tyrosinivorans]|nr:DUF2796 domain-containing protein [Idiomarina tyrosinivorans]
MNSLLHKRRGLFISLAAFFLASCDLLPQDRTPTLTVTLQQQQLALHFEGSNVLLFGASKPHDMSQARAVAKARIRLKRPFDWIQLPKAADCQLRSVNVEGLPNTSYHMHPDGAPAHQHQQPQPRFSQEAVVTKGTWRFSCQQPAALYRNSWTVHLFDYLPRLTQLAVDWQDGETLLTPSQRKWTPSQ